MTRPKARIATTPDGFPVVRGEREEGRVRLSDVREIVTFKRDLITTDCICLAFRMTDDTSIEINEELDGWDSVTAEMTKRFPDIEPGWFGRVMQPPMATNWTRLWG